MDANILDNIALFADNETLFNLRLVMRGVASDMRNVMYKLSAENIEMYLNIADRITDRTNLMAIYYSVKYPNLASLAQVLLAMYMTKCIFDAGKWQNKVTYFYMNKFNHIDRQPHWARIFLDQNLVSTNILRQPQFVDRALDVLFGINAIPIQNFCSTLDYGMYRMLKPALLRYVDRHNHRSIRFLIETDTIWNTLVIENDLINGGENRLVVKRGLRPIEMGQKKIKKLVKSSVRGYSYEICDQSLWLTNDRKLRTFLKNRIPILERHTTRHDEIDQLIHNAYLTEDHNKFMAWMLYTSMNLFAIGDDAQAKSEWLKGVHLAESIEIGFKK